MNVVFLLFACLTTLVVFQAEATVSAELDGSFEVINLNGAEELSFISNLQMDFADEMNTTRSLYYTAERGDSNVYTAHFLQGGGPSTFTASGNSSYEKANLPPFMTFDVSGPNVVGPAFTLSPPFGIQNVIINGSGIHSSITSFLGFTFVAVTVDLPFENQAYVYLAGWSARPLNAFVLARTTLTVGSSSPLAPLTPDDVIYLNTGTCYDQYDEIKHPHLYLAAGYLILIMTGRCASFARVQLPAVISNDSFADAEVTFYDPAIDIQYVPSAAFDNDTAVIYYVVKEFNTPTARVYAFDTNFWDEPQLVMDLVDMERDTELIVVYAPSTLENYLVIIGTGSDRVERYTIQEDNTLSNKAATLLESELDTVYSALYYDPYIYFATYEPDAKIARLNINNFCNLWCSTNGYCVSASCVCKRGYVNDPSAGCIFQVISPAEQVLDNKIVGLAILSALAIVFAIAGWFLWHRSRSTYTSIK